MNTPATGTLYGIGVGPGDPELIPIKAVRILQRVDVVFAAASTKNDHSHAVNIARSHIPPTTEVRRLAFPMTKDPAVKQSAWRDHARTLIVELDKGREVAFLTVGDSMTYATYGYVVKYVQKLAPHIPIETIPGITSYQAAAARVNTPLVEGEESLLLLSGVEGGQQLRQLSTCAETVVFLKAYRNTRDIIAALDEVDMLTSAVCVANCGLQNEKIIHDIRQIADRPPGYWTLIIAKRNSGP